MVKQHLGPRLRKYVDYEDPLISSVISMLHCVHLPSTSSHTSAICASSVQSSLENPHMMLAITILSLKSFFSSLID